MTCFRKRKRVQFSADIQSSAGPSPFIITNSAKETMWFGKDELKEIRSKASKIGAGLHTREDLSNPASYPSVMHRSYTACLKGSLPSNQDFRHLVHYTRSCEHRRGLERTSLPGITRDRMKRTFHLVHTILAIQKRGLQYSPEKLQEMMSKASKMLSRPSTISARLTGITDASAVENDKEPGKRALLVSTSSRDQSTDFSRNVRRRLSGSSNERLTVHC